MPRTIPNPTAKAMERKLIFKFGVILRVVMVALL